MQTISYIVQIPKVALGVAVARAEMDQERLCLRLYKECSLWGIHSLVGDKSCYRKVQELKTLGWIREVSREQGCQHSLGEIIFFPSTVSLWFNGRQLVIWLESEKTPTKQQPTKLFQVWGPFAFAQTGAAGIPLVLALGRAC